MGFVDAVKSVYGNYANFKGRASRSEFWWFVLFYMIVATVLNMVAAGMGKAGGIIGIIYLIFVLGTLVPYIAVAVRRVHDSDKVGWWILLPLYNLYLYIIKGTDGPNRFGDPVV